MDGLLKILAAFVAALNAATGAPVDVNSMPDRPPIMVPTLAPLPTLPLSSALPANGAAADEPISGTITNLQEGFVFVNGVPVLLGPATRVNGQLRVGLDVRVQAKLRADGVLEANELDLSEKLVGPPPTAQPTQKTRNNAGDEPVATPTLIKDAKPTSPEIKPTEDLKPQTSEKLEANPTERPTAQPTERSQVEPTAQPTARPTEKTQIEPTEKPGVQPTPATPKPSNDGDKTVQNGTTTQPSSKSGDSGASNTSGTDSGGFEDHPQGD